MITLTESTDLIEIVLSGAVTTNQLDCYVAYEDVVCYVAYEDVMDEDDIHRDVVREPGRQVANTNSTTHVTICGAPTNPKERQIRQIMVHNADTASATISIKFNDNGNRYILTQQTLIAGGNYLYQA